MGRRAIRLVPMGDAEARAFLEWEASNYVDTLLQSGAASSREQAQAQMQPFEQLLPQGPATPGMFLRRIEDEDTGERIGSLWFGFRDRNGFREAFLFEIVVDQQHRGKGYGRAALIALEEEARSFGVPSIGLQVFAFNTPARRLYESLGYREISSFMLKELEQ